MSYFGQQIPSGCVLPDWWCDAIDPLYDLDILTYQCDGYSVGQAFDRAAWAKLVGSAVKVDESSGWSTCALPFSDVPADAYYAPYVAALAALKRSDSVTVFDATQTLFRPADYVTRCQATKLVIEAWGLPKPTSGSLPFSDTGSIPAWCLPYVRSAVNGDIVGGSSGPFRPNDIATVGEAAAMVYNAIEGFGRPIPTASDFVSGACASSCTPSCGGKDCGDDGCGGSCGTCGGGATCVGGECVTESGAGGTCDSCSSAADCLADWSCRHWTNYPSVSFCAKPCGANSACASGHNCASSGYCVPGVIQQCYQGDVWFYDACGSQLGVAEDCIGEATCEPATGTCVEQVTCAPDVYEPNETQSAASLVGSGAYPNLRVCPTDNDWFRASVPADQELKVTLSFVNADGDVDMELFNANGGEIEASTGSGDSESVSATASSATTFRWRVYGYQGATNSYSMTVTLTPTCVASCAGKSCGSDGCGGTCGSCAAGTACVGGQCQCQADCAGKSCGADGCGGSCGSCGSGAACVAGGCQSVGTGDWCDGCESDDDCVPGWACASWSGTSVSFCTVACDADIECRSDHFCHADGHVCAPRLHEECDGADVRRSDACGNDLGISETCGAGEVCDGASATCACAPNCAGRVCGPDGCGGACGLCGADSSCNASGQCEAICVPSCVGKSCGADGCGGSCGTCAADALCTAGGQCQTGCAPNCGGRVCGDDGCGGSCGSCGASSGCNASGQCEAICVPSCAGRSCGPDGCGGSCGTCAADAVCTAAGQCQASCVPSCAGKVCGADGCGGWCGYCAAGQVCTAAGECDASCAPVCGARECGADGCGGSCGGCPDGTVCAADGHCQAPACAPSCEGRECGSDGCGGACGACGAESFCDASGRCQDPTCVPRCQGRACGSDGCGGLCGECSYYEACTASGQCIVIPNDGGGCATAQRPGALVFGWLAAFALLVLIQIRRRRPPRSRVAAPTRVGGRPSRCAPARSAGGRGASLGILAVFLMAPLGCSSETEGTIDGSVGDADTSAAADAALDIDGGLDGGQHDITIVSSCEGVADQVACDDGNDCTTSTTCTSGVCANGASVACPDPGEPCITAECVQGEGCVTVQEEDGASCGGLCVGQGTCEAGDCKITAGTAIVCPPPDPESCAFARCDPATGQCSTILAREEGSSCNSDGNECTLDVCSADGTCVSTDMANTCAAEATTDPCWSYTCHPTKGCIKAALKEGASCNDNDACTSGDSCVATGAGQGACQGAPLKIDDGNPCTDDSCLAGVVKHTPTEGATCTPDAPCLVSGRCEQGTCVPLRECDCPGDEGCPPPLCSEPCENGGVCIGTDMCDCAGTGYGGPACTQPVCSPICEHGGTCSAANVCDCSDTGYGGPSCAIPSCDPQCENGGACTAPDTCSCDGTGYAGAGCTVPLCSPSCANGGTCTSPNVCDCGGTGYTGPTCADPMCVAACENGGSCTSAGTCACFGTGYSGPTCSVPVCDPACEHGGTCSAPNGCNCAATGYTGAVCDVPICTVSCLNGGVCIAPGSCDCSGTGFGGADCGVELCPAESCNGGDDDCDGATDEEGSVGCEDYFVDADFDSTGASGSERCLCGPEGAHQVRQGGDCDDDDPYVRPGVDERCDGVDNNCDGATDVASCPAAMTCVSGLMCRQDDAQVVGVAQGGGRLSVLARAGTRDAVIAWTTNGTITAAGIGADGIVTGASFELDTLGCQNDFRPAGLLDLNLKFRYFFACDDGGSGPDYRLWTGTADVTLGTTSAPSLVNLGGADPSRAFGKAPLVVGTNSGTSPGPGIAWVAPGLPGAGADGDGSAVFVTVLPSNLSGPGSIQRANTETTGNQGEQGMIDIATSDQGHSLIVWTSGYNISTEFDIHAALLDANGSFLRSQFLANTAVNLRQFAPSVDALSDGNFVVVWRTERFAAPTTVHGQLVSGLNGTLLGSEFMFDATDLEVGEPRVSASRAAFAIVAGQGGRLAIRLFASGGQGPLGPAVDAADVSPNEYDIGWTSPSGVNEFRFVVAWISNGVVYSRTFLR